MASPNQGGNTTNGALTPLADNAPMQSTPLVVIAQFSGRISTSLAVTAWSQPGPPTMLLEVWATTTAEGASDASCAAPCAMSGARTTSRPSSVHVAQGAFAETRAAWIETPGGAIAHHSASGTASAPTMKIPMRACSPQLSVEMATLLDS
ncbi:MAG: hypothetical protein AAGK00_03505 [Pseudomonadota bacterium]